MMKRRLLLLCAAISLQGLGLGQSAELSAVDKALWAKANKVCNGPQYPSGARIVVNYARGTFQCVELGSSRR
jgi:hypothetical protein